MKHFLQFFVVILLFTVIESACAHDFDSLGVLVRHQENKVSLISAPPLAILATNDNGEQLFFDSNSDGNISFEEIKTLEDEITKRVEQLIFFRDEQGHSARLVSLKLLEKGYENLLEIAAPDNKKTMGKTQKGKLKDSATYIQLSLKFEWKNTPQSILLDYGLRADKAKHILVRNQNNGESQVLVLEPDNSAMTIFPINNNISGKTKAIWILGIEHVLAGLDHLLFILTLVLVCKTSLGLVAPLFVFTVAHSLALVLIALGVEINISSWIIEASIAMTIVIMALFELLSWKPKRLYWVTAIMGIIHGFGLGQALTDSMGGLEGWVMALVQVTIGIELAQLTVALIFLVMLSYASKRLKAKKKKLESWISIMVICVGLSWTLERVLS
jgi:hydrogenase/urease accessory protein HupE